MSHQKNHTTRDNKLNRKEILDLLSLQDEKEIDALSRKAFEVKREFTGNKVYLRGLLEVSNICRKNCYYCGIRKGNKKVHRYLVKREEVLDAARFAHDHGFGSLVFQSGERTDKKFIDYIDGLLREIHKITNNSLGITLSLGEQKKETYKRWKDSGAHRYLLRIETSNEELYYKLHPEDETHAFRNRIKALEDLKKLSYQTGTGVMIGLPFQTTGNLADDLLFMKNFDVDMVGMGPYIEHAETPLQEHFEKLPSKTERYQLALKMIATLRLLMPDINIASTTALETLHPDGRLNALKSGTNVFMPNLTPSQYREDYFLYDGKPGINMEIIDYLKDFDQKLKNNGQQIGWGEQGNSKHWKG